MATRRSIQIEAFNGWVALASGCRAIDEQTSLGNDLLAGLQISLDLDEIAIGQPGLDLAKFDRLVFMRDPDSDLIALVDQGLLGHAHGRMIAGGIDRDVSEHLRLQQTVLVVERGAYEKPAVGGINRCRDIVDARR